MCLETFNFSFMYDLPVSFFISSVSTVESGLGPLALAVDCCTWFFLKQFVQQLLVEE